jgi:hypothetical protein
MPNPGDHITVKVQAGGLTWLPVHNQKIGPLALTAYVCCYTTDGRWCMWDGSNWYYINETPIQCFAREFGHGGPGGTATAGCKRCNGTGKMLLFNGLTDCTCVTP